MIDDLDLKEIRKVRKIGYYFRYPLHRSDFHELTLDGNLRGHYTAKPLYGRLTSEGRVDKSAGFNGDIAALFVSLEAVSAHDVKTYITHTDPEKIQTSNGKKDWDVINTAAERCIKANIASS